MLDKCFPFLRSGWSSKKIFKDHICQKAQWYKSSLHSWRVKTHISDTPKIQGSSVWSSNDKYIKWPINVNCWHKTGHSMPFYDTKLALGGPMDLKRNIKGPFWNYHKWRTKLMALVSQGLLKHEWWKNTILQSTSPYCKVVPDRHTEIFKHSADIVLTNYHSFEVMVGERERKIWHIISSSQPYPLQNCLWLLPAQLFMPQCINSLLVFCIHFGQLQQVEAYRKKNYFHKSKGKMMPV